jgi:enolase
MENGALRMHTTRIKKLAARQLIDCKCRPLLEVDVYTEGGAMGRGGAPTGTSVGSYEAFILRDNDPSEYDGMSVHKAVKMVNDVIAPALVGLDVMDQRELDKRMLLLDGTPDKSKLGGNSIYSVSVACIRAAAACKGIPLYLHLSGGKIETLPIPTFNMVNGGHYKDFSMAFNEFIVAPYKAEHIEEAVEIGVKVFQKLGETIEKYNKGATAGVGQSYGYIPPNGDPEIVLDLMAESIEHCGYTKKVAFALDCASNEMYDGASDTYLLKGNRVTADELIDYMEKLTRKYNLLYVEDLLYESDWDGYVKAVRALPRTNIIGDDFIATSVERLKKAHEMNAMSGFIFKPNQIGTVSEALDAFDFAKQCGLLAIPSGRSGGVLDDVIMDFAVGLGIGVIKTGAPRSGERIDKLNFLLRASSKNAGVPIFDASGIVRF